VIIPAVMLVRLGVMATMPAVFWVERPIRSFAPDFVWARKLFGYGAWGERNRYLRPLTLPRLISKANFQNVSLQCFQAQ
jgi:hypothetical protein